jgi:hypothetical protein
MARELISKCTAQDPLERPTFKDIFATLSSDKVGFKIMSGIDVNAVKQYNDWVTSELFRTDKD